VRAPAAFGTPKIVASAVETEEEERQARGFVPLVSFSDERDEVKGDFS